MSRIHRIPDEQQKVLMVELLVCGINDNLEDYKVEITDGGTSQFQIKLDSDAYIFTQADFIHPETNEFSDFRAEYGKFSDYTPQRA